MRLVVPGVLYLDLRFAPALDEGYTKVKASSEDDTVPVVPCNHPKS